MESNSTLQLEQMSLGDAEDSYVASRYTSEYLELIHSCPQLS